MDEPLETCPKCGRTLENGAACGYCSQGIALQLVQQELVLLILLSLVTFGLYIGTLRLAQSNRRIQRNVAASWFRKGQERLAQGDANAAVTAFRKAIANDRNSLVFLRSLATALESAGRDDEAEQLLLQLRERLPEDPEVNLELARISAKRRNVSDAIRYYHNALYGIWTGDKVDERRWDVRRELIKFLLQQQDRDQALAEILALASHLPDTAAAHNELGQLFLKAGDAQHALEDFNVALRHNKQDRVALVGAGQAAFQLGQYTRARRYLSAVPALDPNDRDMLNVATLVLESDPLEPRLSYEERNKRVISGLDQARAGVQACLSRQHAPADHDALAALQSKLEAQKQLLSPLRLRKKPDLVFSTLDLIAQAETGIAKACGPLQGRDKALWLVARSRGTEQ
jgi:tetratricopeptide (TPR) repeat protein